MLNEITVSFSTGSILIRPLGRINIFVGENGIGKSRILESIPFPRSLTIFVDPDSRLGRDFNRRLSYLDLPLLCIDEIENGIYYKNLESLWRTMREYLRRVPESQVFASTHSLECIDAALNVFNVTPDPSLMTGAAFDIPWTARSEESFFLHRLQKGEDGTVIVQTLPFDQVYGMRYHFGLEVR